MQNRAQEQYNGSRKVLTLYTPVKRDSCKFTLRVVNMSINFQHAAVQNVPYLTTQPHCKIQLRCKNAFVLADGAKFRFKFIRRYGANLLNLYAQLNKFHSKFYAA